ncbi:hypothetical protein [Methanoregula sp.]|jgi:hypothetical protein|uniref:hypothetical protein n=1 Tax=Methanoregula sp. TaxID=2052170 RepID=UPI003BB06361
MKEFKLPEEVGSDYDKPTIIVIKKLKMYSNLNDERTFSDCCCESYGCHHSPPGCSCNNE